MNKIYNNIGLAHVASKVVFGTDNIINGLKTKKVSLIIMSSQCSFNTQKIIQDKACTYNTKVIMLNEYNDESITKATGKENVKVIGIKDKGFRRMIL
ncbi:MAG: L7Ae/L30e/S12e/Gadd45 family ribosomal protein, partial [Mycoplasmatales bacterium]